MMLLENDHKYQYATINNIKYLLVEPNTLYKLEATTAELVTALEDIVNHQEYIAPNMAQFTGSWRIATAALVKHKQEHK